MNRIALVIIIVVSLLFSSCEKEENKSENFEFNANIAVSDSYAFRENEGRIYLWDLKNNRYEIFCTQPDCKHQTISENPNTKCSAIVPKEGYFCNYAFIYNDKIYSVCTGELNEFLIYEADTDGLNRKLVFTADVSFSSSVFPSLIGSKLVFVGSKFDTDDIKTQNMKEHYLLCTVDLSDFSFKNYAEIGVANETIIGKESLSFYKNRIYFQHSEYTENNANSTVEYIDIDSLERKIILEVDKSINVWQYDGGKMLYVVSDYGDTHSQVYSYDLDRDKSEMLFEQDNYLSDIYMCGDKIFYMYSITDDEKSIRGAGVYDISNGENVTDDFDNDLYVSILGHTLNGHLIHYQNFERDSFGILSDEDFWNLRFEKAKFKFDQ